MALRNIPLPVSMAIIYMLMTSFRVTSVSSGSRAQRLGVIHSEKLSKSARLKIEHVFKDILQTQYGGTRVELVWLQTDIWTVVNMYRQVCAMIDDGIQGVVSMLPTKPAIYFCRLANTLCLHHMTTHGIFQNQFPYIMSWSDPNPNQLIVDVINHFQWKSVGIIYDRITGMKQLSDLLYRLSMDLVQVKLVDAQYFTNRFSNMSQRMLYLGSAAGFHSMIHKNKGLLNSTLLWLVVAEDMNGYDIGELFQRHTKGRMVFVKRKWKDTYECNNCSICMEHNHSMKLSLQEKLLVDSLTMLHEALRNVTFSGQQNGPSLCHRSRNQRYLYSEFCSNVPVGDKSTRILPALTYEIHSSHNALGHAGTTHLKRRNFSEGWPTKTGEWDSVNGLRLGMDLNPFHSLWHGHERIYVAALESPPFVVKTAWQGVTKYSGFSVDIMNELALRMGFNFTIVEPADGFYGSPNEDGTWNGMVGMVLKGEAEMAIGPITITSLREQVIDFTKPVTEGSSGILMRSSGYSGHAGLFQILKPLSTTVWLSICAAIGLMSIVSYIVNYNTPYQTGMNLHVFTREREMRSFKANCWMIYASITEQGVEVHPRSTSGRCVLGFWWVFTILLVASYTANLTAVLTVVIPPSPINSLYELIEQDTIQPVVQAGTSFETTFQLSESDLYKKTWNRLQNSPRLAQESQIFDLVKKGGHAFIADRPVLDYRALSGCDTFTVAEESFDVVGYGIVIPQGALYMETINHLIVKMQEAGLMDKWKRHWWSSNNTCPGRSNRTSLGLDSLGGLFLLYIGTTVLACGCYAVEVCFNQRDPK